MSSLSEVRREGMRSQYLNEIQAQHLCRTGYAGFTLDVHSQLSQELQNLNV